MLYRLNEKTHVVQRKILGFIWMNWDVCYGDGTKYLTARNIDTALELIYGELRYFDDKGRTFTPILTIVNDLITHDGWENYHPYDRVD